MLNKAVDLGMYLAYNQNTPLFKKVGRFLLDRCYHHVSRKEGKDHANI
jgi:hypothetical protein